MANFPDLNDDGKVTRADILKGRGVEGFKNGGMQSGGSVDEEGRVMDKQTMKNQILDILAALAIAGALLIGALAYFDVLTK